MPMVTLSQLLLLLQSKAADVLELNEAHNRYMTLAQHVCLLSPSSRELRLILEIMLQSVVDFASIVRYADPFWNLCKPSQLSTSSGSASLHVCQVALVAQRQPSCGFCFSDVSKQIPVQEVACMCTRFSGVQDRTHRLRHSGSCQ